MIALIFDTETSGLIENHSIKLERQPSVIEYFSATTDLEKGTRLEELEILIKNPKPLEAIITKITGIDEALLADAPAFGEIFEGIKINIEKSEVIIAHNMSFDREIIDIEFERLGMKVKWPRVICSVEASLHYKGFRLNLQSLYEHLFDEPFKGHHRARADVDALERICIEMFKRGDL